MNGSPHADRFVARTSSTAFACRLLLVAATTVVILWSGRAEAQAPAAAPGAGTPGGDRPADEALRAVETEGHRIASYHEAIGKAVARAREKNSDLVQETRTVVVNRGGIWHIVFLRQVITAGVTKGLMAVADAVFQPRAGDLSAFQAFEPPRVAPTDAQSALRAGDNSITRGQQGMPGGTSFDEVMLRDGQGPWTVYLLRRSHVAGTALI